MSASSPTRPPAGSRSDEGRPTRYLREKAERLHREARVREIPSSRIFVVRGDSGPHLTILTGDGAGLCDCPATVRACSHVLAARLATKDGNEGAGA